MTSPVTLGDLSREGKLLWVYCCECYHERNGERMDFDTPEALARAVQSVRAGTPLVVRDERDGTKQVLWAPGDVD